MAFTIDTETQKITFTVVSDLTNDAISIPLADQFGVSELFNDRFIYTSQALADISWVPNDSSKIRVNTGTEVLDFNAVLDSTNDAIVHDLGSGISNSEWVLRFSVEFSTLVESLSNVLFIGLSDSNQTVASGSAQDGLWLGLQYTALFHRVGTMDTDGTVPGSASFDDFTEYTLSTGTKYYVEIKRTASTTYTIGLFSDSEYTASVVTATGTCPASVIGLKYIKVFNQSTVTQAGNFQGKIDDVQFWNGTTTPKITSDHWRIRYKLNITGLVGGDTIDKRLYIGLFDEDALSGASNVQDGYFIILAHDTVTSLIYEASANGEQPRLATSDITLTTPPSVSTFYVEMSRTSPTTGNISLYPDDTFTTPSESVSFSGLTGTLGLRYLKLMNDEGFGVATGSISGTFDNFVFQDLQNVSDFGLVAYWQFEEISGVYPNKSESLASGGTDWDLIVGSGLTRGSSSIVPCQNFAIEGTGTDDFMAPSSGSTSLGSFITDKVHDWSLNLWIQQDAYNFIWFLNSANTSASNIGLEMITAGGVFDPRVRQFNSGNGEVYKPSGNFEFINTIPLDNLWHMISFGYKVSTDQLWSSVDGITKTYESNGGTAVGFTTSDGIIRIFNRAIFPPITVTLDGKMDEWSIWSRELTDAEISTLYNAGSAHSIYEDTCVPQAKLFLVDARLTSSSGYGLYRDIGDLIIRVLTENPLGLTGDAITDKIREITEVELEWGFLGKKHRVKGWLNKLFKDNIVQNDGSDPDWWQSVWTLV